jgi:hypothetical protein
MVVQAVLEDISKGISKELLESHYKNVVASVTHAKGPVKN